MKYIKNMLKNPKHWKKFWVALSGVLGVFLLVLAPMEGQDAFVITKEEWYIVLVAAAAAVGVERVANR